MIHFKTLVTAIAFGLLAGPLAAPAAAQSENELRRENQALRTRVRDLERELQAAKDKIAQLEQQLRNAGTRDMPPPKPDEVSVDETIPTTSPRALHATLKASYEAEMEALGPIEDERGRRAMARALESWAARVNKEHKSRIAWHIKVLDVGSRVRVQAVDPKTGTALGDAFLVRMERQAYRRMEDVLRRDPKGALVLRGTLVPLVRINPDRATAGPFDNPPLIGPFAEFGFRIDVRSIAPPSPEPEGKEEKSTGSGG